ncbi:hypothetical protein BVG16_16765 [Paenibacillus selenitireducens]|uniref:Uncharacterized protein n=1 Tax=Paenibacillus selenitireducens TaxID=1324314 RepID=A0A1T2XA92_9BACL|nr:hypothetical protein [Paenibacillus selenitireducens]OPA76811.1 hypothetical protein BVG16_16765 [Paenibacillus selenitireducens]
MNVAKTLLCNLVVLLTVTACSSGTEPKPEYSEDQVGSIQSAPAQQKSTVSNGEKEEIIKKLQDELSKLNEAADAVTLTESYIKNTGEKQADHMFMTLEDFYDKNITIAQERFSRTEVQEALLKISYPITAEKVATIPNKEIRHMVEQQLNGKYKLESAEGMIFPVVDYEGLKMFQPYLTVSMKDYINLQAIQSNEPVAKDAGLVISREELMKRTEQVEKYLLKYQQMARYDRVKQMYLNHLQMLLLGLNNTPTFDYDTYKLNPDVKKEFQQLINKHPDTVTSRVVDQFLQILSKTKDHVYTKKDGQQTDILAVRSFLDGLDDTVEKLIRQMTTEG